nr:hypothetical protein [Tanacetum cinerariifolium]
MIDQGVNAVLVARDANRTGDDSHTSKTGVRRTERELALLFVRTYPEEYDRVERYIGGLPDLIHKSVAASKTKTMQEATEMATGLMDKKIRTYAERQGCMPWAMQGQTQMRTPLRVRSFSTTAMLLCYLVLVPVEVLYQLHLAINLILYQLS